MNAEARTVRLQTLQIATEHDVVLCRQRARQYSERFGFHAQDQTRIATAVSEIARNAFQYAGGGKVEFSMDTTTGTGTGAASAKSTQEFVIRIRDGGPGIARLEDVLSGRVPSRTGLGIGIVGTRRLMDRVEFTSSSTGTSVEMRKELPEHGKKLTPAALQKIVDDIARKAPASALEDVQVQNQELLRLMEELQQHREQIENANRELAATNAGILALYDELDTLHRVSLLLATKVDLLALIQALVSATTELTGAEWGACFLKDAVSGRWSFYTASGTSALDTINCTEVPQEEILFTSTPDEVPELVNLAALPGLSPTPFLRDLCERTSCRNLLAVPVVEGGGKVLAEMVFGSSSEAPFIERSERIVLSIATQAVVAIEKVRLFDRVREASEAKDRFLAMVSHELRTPLNPVLAIISSLHEDPGLPESLREDIRLVHRNVQLEARLIDDLLDFHRLVNGKVTLETAPLDLHEVIKMVLQICEQDAREKNQVISTRLAADRSVILGDLARIQQVLWNVLKNAIKFSPAGSGIEIETAVEDGTICCISVTDHGRGISHAALPFIFAAFDQGDLNLRPSDGGLGLGLAIAKTFVEKHGGTVSAYSGGGGHGTTMTVRLPLTTVTLPAPLSPRAARIDRPARSRRILLVDDHADTVTALGSLLRRLGHEVQTACNCEEAMAIFARARFDVVISDLGLPDRTGLELIAEIRKTSNVAAIAMSGFGMASDVAGSLAAGFNRHLTKPVSMVQLVEHLAALP